jgi:hypothetical protein
MSQVGLDGIDGILGLSPDVQGNGPSFIGHLKKEQIIDDKIVGFFIGDMQY